MSDVHQTEQETSAESRTTALDLFKPFLAISPNTLKQGLSGEEFARELIRGAEALLKYVNEGIIP
jgi:hypothetical protein